MPYDPEKHHRRSIRLPGYDYAQEGAYFVTLCTHEREPLLGEIVQEIMQLSPWGQLVDREWLQTAVIRPQVELGPYVVMPNHVHGILVIHGQGVLMKLTN
jgi:putative transposase